MSPRVLLVTLLFVLPITTTAQQTRNEVTGSLGRTDLNPFGDGPAFGVSYNRYWNPMFSTRLGVFAGGNENASREIVSGAYHLSAEIHPLGQRIISPWAGIGLALAVTDVDHVDEAFVSSETSLTGIYSGGLDFNLTRRFAIGGEVLYLKHDDALGIALDQLTVMGSARFRW